MSVFMCAGVDVGVCVCVCGVGVSVFWCVCSVPGIGVSVRVCVFVCLCARGVCLDECGRVCVLVCVLSVCCVAGAASSPTHRHVTESEFKSRATNLPRLEAQDHDHNLKTNMDHLQE